MNLQELRDSFAVPYPKTSNSQGYVAGFLFRDKGISTEVALIRKNRPTWQANCLNGIGGKIESGESPLEAMKREFYEEAGALIEDWRPVAVLTNEGQTFDVFFFACKSNNADIASKTSEEVRWFNIYDLEGQARVNNLDWLIPLALNKDKNIAYVIEPVTKPHDQIKG